VGHALRPRARDGGCAALEQAGARPFELVAVAAAEAEAALDHFALFLPRMLGRDSGHVVNVSSIAGWVAAGGMTVYSASKFGVRGFGDSLTRDLEETGVRVTTVFPFFSRTPILDSIQFGEDPPRKVPDDIVTEPADVVRAILKGICEDREYVFPDPMARRLHLLQRYFPRLVLWFGRRFEERTRADGEPG